MKYIASFYGNNPGMCPGLEEWWLKQTGDVVYYVHLHTLEMILYCLVTISGGHFKLSGGWS